MTKTGTRQKLVENARQKKPDGYRYSYLGAKGNTSLRRMRNEETDMELLFKWLTNPMVIRYVYEEGAPWTLDKVREEFAEKMTEEGTTTPCLILYEGREVGYLQYYPITEDSYKFNDLATYERIKGGYGVDMFIGEPELWQKGIGSRALGILEEYLKKQLEVSVICVDPATDNERGMNFWPKVGFEPVDTVENYDDCSKLSVLMVKSLCAE